MHPLTREETATLLEAAHGKTPRIYALLLCAVRTGLRRSELIGLQWGDVEVENRYLMVRHAIVRGHEGLPKSGRIRRVAMSPQLCAALIQLRQIREGKAIAKGQTLRMDEPVFLSPMGFRWDEHNLDKLWRRALKASGIRNIRLHDLRHTLASQLIEQGAHPK
jgi:integrase